MPNNFPPDFKSICNLIKCHLNDSLPGNILLQVQLRTNPLLQQLLQGRDGSAQMFILRQILKCLQKHCRLIRLWNLILIRNEIIGGSFVKIQSFSPRIWFFLDLEFEHPSSRGLGMTRGPENVHMSSQLFSGIDFEYLPPPPRSDKVFARCRQPHTMASLVSKWQPDHAGSRWVSEVHKA